MTDHEVIAAFADGERVEARALKHALSTSAGIDYLMDVMALREILDESGATVPDARVAPPLSRPIRWIAVAAGICLAALAGYGVGAGRTAAPPAAPASVAQDAGPPKPTVVIKLRPGVGWQDVRPGGGS